MNTTPRAHYSFPLGAKVLARGLKVMATKNLVKLIWIYAYSYWFVGGGALMLYWGSTSLLPLACMVTPFIALPWLALVASRYGFSRLLALPRVVPWLVAMGIALMEYVDGTHLDQPEGYYTFLVGFLIINGIATAFEFIDIYRWFRGDRAENPDTGFFGSAS